MIEGGCSLRFIRERLLLAAKVDSRPPVVVFVSMASSAKSSALYPISVEGIWGFIDATGKVVIEPQFHKVSNFSEGLACVTVVGEDELFPDKFEEGFIDETGKFVIGPGAPPKADLPKFFRTYSYGDFHDGRATIWINDATGAGGYIDKTGKLVIPAKYVQLEDFSEGLAWVAMPRSDGSIIGPKRSGLLDTNGNFVIAPKLGFSGRSVHQGLYVTNREDKNRQSLTSVVDLQGKVVVPEGEYSYIGDFAGGLSVVVKDRKIGCIDRQGKVAIPIEFETLADFEEEKFTTGEKAGKKFIVDRNGTCVREIAVDEEVSLGRIKSGMVKVHIDKKVGYVNTAGELTVPIQYDFRTSTDFDGELARVGSGNITGYINKQGTFVWKTDRWEKPIRNSVKGPLKDFLPPGTIEALPLDYNWDGVKNSIVFATNEPIEELRLWFKKKLGKQVKFFSDVLEDGRLELDFSSDALAASFYAMDMKTKDGVAHADFYGSKNMRLLQEKHKPAVVGILISTLEKGE